MLVAVVAGVGVAALFDLTTVDSSAFYSLCVTTLLGFGLYASSSGIAVDEFRTQLRTVLLAVTLGVVAKALLIFAVMYLVFQDPRYLVLGVAVAQIDPLSVAAVYAKSRMSARAKTLLAAWASFDDPITVLLTVYVTAFVLSAQHAPAAGELLGAGLGEFLLNLAANLFLAGLVYVVWRAGTKKLREKPRKATHLVRSFAVLGIIAVAVLAVWFSLLLALALIGLFLRPKWRLERVTNAAVLIATFAVGLVLVGGVAPVRGAVLGFAAYSAQIVVALVLTIPRMWRGDRGRLALGQQNGMTAIVLALILEPTFPGTVAVVAPAIVVVNLLYVVCNAVWDRLTIAPTPAPISDAATATPAIRTTDPVGISRTGSPARGRVEPAD